MLDRHLSIVVVPSDPISAYEKKGIASWLETYYNPGQLFDEVFALSPLEQGVRKAYGMTIIGVREQDFITRLRELRPNVVRAYGGYWPADFVCRHRIQGVPVVVSVHDTLNIHESVRYADLVICMSKAVGKKVLQLGVSPERIRIMPNRIDMSSFRPLPWSNAFDELNARFPYGKHILHIGRKADEKNLDTLIMALPHLPVNYSCIFVGQGDKAPYLELAKRARVDDRCFWIDSISNTELPIWYSWCDCMCVPSRREGFGLVFIEAAACGAAIVTSDIAPMNEYLVDGVSASLLAEYQNPRRLAESIVQVCEDTAYRETITAGGIKAAQSFAKERVSKIEQEIYDDVLNMKKMKVSRKLEILAWRMGQIFAELAIVPRSFLKNLARKFVLIG